MSITGYLALSQHGNRVFSINRTFLSFLLRNKEKCIIAKNYVRITGSGVEVLCKIFLKISVAQF